MRDVDGEPQKGMKMTHSRTPQGDASLIDDQGRDIRDVIVREALGPVMKQAGFTGRGRVFRRRTDEVYQAVQIFVSHNVMSLWVGLTVNRLSPYLWNLADYTKNMPQHRPTRREPNGNSPPLAACQFMSTMSSLPELDQRTHWMLNFSTQGRVTLELEQIGRDVLLPWMDRHRTWEQVEQLAHRWNRLDMLAADAYDRGHADDALALIQSAGYGPNDGMTEWVKDLLTEEEE